MRRSPRISRRLADFLEREGAQVSRTARPGFNVIEAFHLYLRLLTAALSGRASEEMLERMRDAKARRPADDMSADAISVRAVDMTHREWLHLNERRMPAPPHLGRILPGMGCAAVSADRHRRAAAHAAGRDLGTAG